MQIIWKGQSCFQISLQPEKNNQVRIVIDPFDETLGLKLPSMEADILLITHHHRDHDNVKAIKGNPFLIDGPGEYESFMCITIGREVIVNHQKIKTTGF